MDKIIAPYGNWKSLITADLITAKTIGFVQHCIDGEDIYWSESRPMEISVNVHCPISTSGLVCMNMAAQLSPL